MCETVNLYCMCWSQTTELPCSRMQ